MLSSMFASSRKRKKEVFIAVGLGTAISAATQLISSTTSWITSLIAIAGGSAYSSFKNMETASSIIKKQHEISDIVKRLSLQKYKTTSELDSIINELLKDTLEKISADPNGVIIDSIAKKVSELEADLKKSTPSSKQYALINLIGQAALSAIVGYVNISANFATPEEKADHYSTTNILNMAGAFVSVLSQYLLHSAYTASNLRRIATCTDKLHAILLKAQESLPFRALELQMKRKSLYAQGIAERKKEIAGCEKRIKIMKENIQSLDKQGRDSSKQNERLIELAKEKHDLFTELRKYRKRQNKALVKGQNEIDIINEIARKINLITEESSDGNPDIADILRV